MGERQIFYTVFAALGAVLFVLLVLTRAILPFGEFAGGLNYFEQALYALILALPPVLLWISLRRRSRSGLTFLRLLSGNLPQVLFVFLLQVAAFAAFEIDFELALPVTSNLFDAGLVRQIAAYSRVPLLAQLIAIFLFTAAFAAATVAPGDKLAVRCLQGLGLYLLYVALFIFCNQWWKVYFAKLLFPPNRLNFFLLFVHWLPAVFFLVLTYWYLARKRK